MVQNLSPYRTLAVPKQRALLLSNHSICIIMQDYARIETYLSRIHDFWIIHHCKMVIICWCTLLEDLRQCHFSSDENGSNAKHKLHCISGKCDQLSIYCHLDRMKVMHVSLYLLLTSLLISFKGIMLLEMSWYFFKAFMLKYWLVTLTQNIK